MSVDDAIEVEQRTRPTCRAVVPDGTGKTRKCDQRAVVTWWGNPYCFAHAPHRIPGRGGWGRLDATR